MKNFALMKPEIRRILDDADYQKAWIKSGPELPDVPGHGVLLTRYGGPGLETGEGILDARSWQVRCVGRQNSPDYAEGMADAIDIVFLSHYSRSVGGVWVSSIQRVGGAPAALMVDDADRTHFVCSYIVSVELALAN